MFDFDPQAPLLEDEVPEAAGLGTFGGVVEISDGLVYSQHCQYHFPRWLVCSQWLYNVLQNPFDTAVH